MKEKLMEYILQNFTIEVGTARRLLDNILDWVSIQSMDHEDTVSVLACLLDGIGITKEEIEKVIGGEENG